MSSLPPRRSAIAISPEQELALLHVPARLREAFRALFEIDAAMADVVAGASDPALAAIKLAWWREQLLALDVGAPPGEPRLNAVADHLLGRGVTGAELAELEAGWATLLDEQIDPDLVASRGRRLFKLGARVLGSSNDAIAEAGAFYALGSVAERGVPELRDAAADQLARIRGKRFPRKVRPLTMLARAAATDRSSRRRALAMIAHRWSGRIS